MDTNKTLAEIADHLIDGDEEAAFLACEDLVNWLELGGFEPDWEKCPEAARFYQKEIRGDA